MTAFVTFFAGVGMSITGFGLILIICIIVANTIFKKICGLVWLLLCFVVKMFSKKN